MSSMNTLSFSMWESVEWTLLVVSDPDMGTLIFFKYVLLRSWTVFKETFVIHLFTATCLLFFTASWQI